MLYILTYDQKQHRLHISSDLLNNAEMFESEETWCFQCNITETVTTPATSKQWIAHLVCLKKAEIGTYPDVLKYKCLPDSLSQWQAAVIPGFKFLHLVQLAYRWCHNNYLCNHIYHFVCVCEREREELWLSDKSLLKSVNKCLLRCFFIFSWIILWGFFIFRDSDFSDFQPLQISFGIMNLNPFHSKIQEILLDAFKNLLITITS